MSGRAVIRTHISEDPGQCSYTPSVLSQHRICRQALLDPDVLVTMYCVNLGMLFNFSRLKFFIFKNGYKSPGQCFSVVRTFACAPKGPLVPFPIKGTCLCCRLDPHPRWGGSRVS